ncbi:hypothetical protein WA577_003107 [Blastocystis sp. JDR]
MSCKECRAFQGILSEARVVSVPRIDLSGYVAVLNHTDILISFRATDTVLNWIENVASPFFADFLVCPHCKASLVYLKMYRRVRPQLLGVLIPLLTRYPNATIVATGHSMGGIFATYAAVDLLSNVNHYNYEQYLKDPEGFPVVYAEGDTELQNLRGIIPFKQKCHVWNHHIQVKEVVTFGMPRIGNRYLADYIQRIIPTYARITHYRDLIPRLPPSFTDYHHTGDEYWFNRDSTEYKVCSYPEQKGCINSVILLNTDDHAVYMGLHSGQCEMR